SRPTIVQLASPGKSDDLMNLFVFELGAGGQPEIGQAHVFPLHVTRSGHPNDRGCCARSLNIRSRKVLVMRELRGDTSFCLGGDADDHRRTIRLRRSSEALWGLGSFGGQPGGTASCSSRMSL